MTTRSLSIINAIGCLALTAIIVAQWRKERVSNGTITTLRTELAAAQSQAADEASHRAALERDITVLKETIAATQQAAEASAFALGEKDALASRLQTDLTTARNQVAAWETALKSRDEKIRTLDAELAAARKLLDEAIAKLKAAAPTN